MSENSTVCQDIALDLNYKQGLSQQSITSIVPGVIEDTSSILAPSPESMAASRD